MAQAAEVEEGAIEVSPERKAEVRQRLQEIRRGSTLSKWDEGELLAEVMDGGYYDGYGFQSFDHYCREELGYADRTGFRRMGVWRTFHQELGYEREQLANHQWSKLELIFGIVKKSNVEGWLSDCEKLSFDQLEYKVKDFKGRVDEQDGKGKKRGEGKSKGKTRPKNEQIRGEGAEGEDGNEPKVTLRVVMFQSQYENVKAAFEMAYGQLENRKMNYALDMIAADFQAGYIGKENDGGSHKRLQVVCEDLARSHNATITVTMNKGSVSDQFAKDRESSLERKKKLREAAAAQSNQKPKEKKGKKK